MKFSIYQVVVSKANQASYDSDKPYEDNKIQFRYGKIMGVRGSQKLEYLVQFDYNVCASPLWIKEDNLFDVKV